MKGSRLMTPHWPLYPEALGVISGALKHATSIATPTNLRILENGSELPCSCACRHTETCKSVPPGQTYSELDVQTSVFCSILKQISDDHQYPDDPFVALADFSRKPENGLLMNFYVA